MAEYSEEEQLAALRNFWQRYGLWIAIGLVLVIGGYLAWSYYKHSQLQRAQAASEVYEDFQQNVTDEAVSNPLAQRLDDEFEGSSYQVFSLFTRAATAVENGELETAAAFLETASSGGAEQELKDVALLRLARLRQQMGDSDAALTALGATRGEGNRSLVAELKGDIHLVRGEADLAREAYAAAMENVEEPDSRPLLQLKLSQLQEPN